MFQIPSSKLGFDISFAHVQTSIAFLSKVHFVENLFLGYSNTRFKKIEKNGRLLPDLRSGQLNGFSHTDSKIQKPPKRKRKYQPITRQKLRKCEFSFSCGQDDDIRIPKPIRVRHVARQARIRSRTQLWRLNLNRARV